MNKHFELNSWILRSLSMKKKLILFFTLSLSFLVITLDYLFLFFLSKLVHNETKMSERLPFIRFLDDISISNASKFVIIVMILRVLCSFFITFLLNRVLISAAIGVSKNVINGILHSEYRLIKKERSQELVYISTQAVDQVFMTYFGSLITLVVEVISLFFLVLFLSFVNAKITLIVMAGMLFAVASIIKVIATRQTSLAQGQTFYNLEVSEKIIDSISFYKENFVRVTTPNNPLSAAASLSYLQNIKLKNYLLPQLSRTILETIFVITVGLVFISNSTSNDFQERINTTIFFIGALSRIVPILAKLINQLLQISQAYGYIKEQISKLISLSEPKVADLQESRFHSEQSLKDEDDNVLISVQRVSFCFEDSKENVLSNLNFSLRRGESILILGPSGAGKTTLIDLILGLYSPSSGTIQIMGLSPNSFVKKYPGKIAYVPQECIIMNSGILENITMSLKNSKEDEKRARGLLAKLGLEELWTREKILGWAKVCGERGMRLSGGERQRIALARSLFTNPDLIVMDEPTSALDKETRDNFIALLEQESMGVAKIIVSHDPVYEDKVNQVLKISTEGNGTLKRSLT